VDAEAAKRFDKLEAKLDAYFLGSDGHHHTVESAVAHVTQGAAYKSKRGTLWARLFRRSDARATIVAPVKK
jgi:hypothetical protein